jgi:hypothetical protein
MDRIHFLRVLLQVCLGRPSTMRSTSRSWFPRGDPTKDSQLSLQCQGRGDLSCQVLHESVYQRPDLALKGTFQFLRYDSSRCHTRFILIQKNVKQQTIHIVPNTPLNSKCNIIELQISLIRKPLRGCALEVSNHHIKNFKNFSPKKFSNNALKKKVFNRFYIFIEGTLQLLGIPLLHKLSLVIILFWVNNQRNT